MKPISFCADFSINVGGIPIPKNAVYGKIKDIYYYFGDYSALAEKHQKVVLYYMDRSSWSFHPVLLNRTDETIKAIIKYLKSNKIYVTRDTKLIFPYGIKHIKMPSEKLAKRDFLYMPTNYDNKNVIEDKNIIINSCNCKNYYMNNRHENAEKYFDLGKPYKY